MKPFPRYDFPVSVRRQALEEDSETAALYENIFDVRLNFKISIMFIPSLYQTVRSSWVPTLPDNVDCISTELEARLITAALSNYIVTPDKELAGTELIIKNDLLQGVKTSIFFYVTPEEFETFTIELSDLAERLFSIHDSRQVSEVNNLDFVKLILSKIITSTHFIKEDLHVLGRAKSINDHSIVRLMKFLTTFRKLSNSEDSKVNKDSFYKN